MMNKLLLLLAVFICSGCTTLGYYHQSITGHFSLISKREPISKIVNDPNRDEKLIEQLKLAQELRSFASSTLKLPDNESYRSYVQLEKPYVTWNVFAAPEFSIALHEWCFLVIGCVQYRGYFDENDAHAYAEKLAAQGLDTYVAGVPAYSTLGWFDDPLLSSMLDRGEIVTASYIFHELAHQQFYLKNDSAFNEAYATAVEELGVQQWLQQQQRFTELEKYEAWLKQKAIFFGFIKSIRDDFAEVYAQTDDTEKLRLKKQNKIQEARQRFHLLSKDHPHLTRYSKWMSGPLNNAQLGAISLYREKVPMFKYLFSVCQRDFEKYHAHVAQLAKLTEEEREQALNSANTCL